MRLSHLSMLAAAAGACVLLPTATSSCSSDSSPEATAPGDDRPLGDALPVDNTVQVDNLERSVDVVRDSYGIVHIYASSITDAFRVQGYQAARDRTVYLELLRRSAEGRMAETFGDVEKGLIDDDISARTIGLTRVAQKIYDALDPHGEEKKILDAYADGVSQFYHRVQTGDEALPPGFVGFLGKFMTPWTGVDSLAIARYQSQSLSFDPDSDISRQGYLDKVRAVFGAASTDPDILARAGFIKDTLRFAPIDPTLVMDAFPNDGSHTLSWSTARPKTTAANVRLKPELLASTQGWLATGRSVDRIFGERGTRGSNNWMVGPSKSATGHPMIANDPHLSLQSPPVFWMAHLSVTVPDGEDAGQNLNVTGLSFPGIPGFVLGFNDHVAWGLTTADYDVSDAYTEKLTADGSGVVYKGQNVPFQKAHETIQVASSSPLEIDVLIVPHHGPIIPNIQNHAIVPPDPTVGAISYRWTGLEPSNELAAFLGLARAKNVEDARVSIRNFAVGAQNFVVADTDGNFFYTSQSRLPQRDPGALAWDASKYEGTLPMFVLPGDGTAEWGADLDEGFIPHVKNPSKGYIATANADQVGVTLDNDPSNDKTPDGKQVYIAGDYDLGFRVGEITKRITTAGKPLTLDDMADIQADVHDGFGERMTPKLLESITHAEAEKATPNSHPDLAAIVADPRYAAANVPELVDWLTKWGTDSDYFDEAGVSLDDGSPLPDAKLANAGKAALLFNTWMVQMGKLTLDDELALLAGAPQPIEVPRVLCYLLTTPPAQLATLDATTQESVLFDDISTQGKKETRDELAIKALLDAVDFLGTKMGTDRSKWLWGSVHLKTFDSLVSLWASFTIPSATDQHFPHGFPRHGGLHTVDVGNWGSHPGQLADVDFTPGGGATQRFVIDMDPAGPVARNVLPGGNVWDPASPYFKNQMDDWRKNKNHPVWIAKADVLKDAKERVVYGK